MHFFGYDNSFYHAVLYPALYRLAFPDWAPDIDYHVNEFYLLEGSKFSTSRRHAIWGKEILTPQSVDAVRYFLSLTRPEGRRTNFGRRGLPHGAGADPDRRLAGLADRPRRAGPQDVRLAGARRRHLDRRAHRLPRPARLRLTALTGSLGRDGFSLNRAAAELNGIVEDTVRFAAAESLLADAEGWRDEARTATALELAAARLLAHGAAPVMPRFAARLAGALGLAAPTSWPSSPQLLTPGSRIDLADQIFFGAPADASARASAGGAADERPALLGWLTDLVAETLQAPAAPADATLLELGASSLQSVLLQYQVLEQLDVDILVDELLGERDLTALAALLAERAEPAAVAAVLSAGTGVAA